MTIFSDYYNLFWEKYSLTIPLPDLPDLPDLLLCYSLFRNQGPHPGMHALHSVALALLSLFTRCLTLLTLHMIQIVLL